MTKRNEQYWKNRAAQRMWEYMQSAEETADEAAKLYQKAAAYLNQEIDGIFEKYMTKHNLSEREAYELLNQMTDRARYRNYCRSSRMVQKTPKRSRSYRNLRHQRIGRESSVWSRSRVSSIRLCVMCISRSWLFLHRIMQRWQRKPTTNRYSTFSNAQDTDSPSLRSIRK